MSLSNSLLQIKHELLKVNPIRSDILSFEDSFFTDYKSFEDFEMCGLEVTDDFLNMYDKLWKEWYKQGVANTNGQIDAYHLIIFNNLIPHTRDLDAIQRIKNI